MLSLADLHFPVFPFLSISQKLSSLQCRYLRLLSFASKLIGCQLQPTKKLGKQILLRYSVATCPFNAEPLLHGWGDVLKGNLSASSWGSLPLALLFFLLLLRSFWATSSFQCSSLDKMFWRLFFWRPYFSTWAFQKSFRWLKEFLAGFISSIYFNLVAAGVSVLVTCEPGFFLFEDWGLALEISQAPASMSWSSVVANSASISALSLSLCLSVSDCFIPFPESILLKSTEPLPFVRLNLQMQWHCPSFFLLACWAKKLAQAILDLSWSGWWRLRAASGTLLGCRFSSSTSGSDLLRPPQSARVSNN